MPRKSFQDPDLKNTVLANLDTHDADSVRISLMPDGSMFLEPGAWPNGKPDSSFDSPILLKPQQAEALWRFFDGSRVRNRMLDTFRRRMLKHGAPELRRIIRTIDRHFDQAEQEAAS